MYSVHDWAKVRRLHDVEGMSKSAIAEKLSMSRNTVARLVALTEPPKYERPSAGSQVDRFADQIAAMLAEDPKVPATVITERLRRCGFAGSVTIVKAMLGRLGRSSWRRRALSAAATCRVSWRGLTGGTPACTCRSDGRRRGRRSRW